MTRNTAIPLTLAAVLALSACGTPQERCISRNTSEYRSVSALLAEVEGNLARGYEWRERQEIDTVMGQCRVPYETAAGAIDYRFEPCWRDVVDTVRYREAIDPAVETRKRDHLAARKAALAAQAAAATEACRAAYPDETKG